MAVDEERTTVPAAPPPAVARCVVRVSGELDLDHASELRTALDTAVSRAPDRADVVVGLKRPAPAGSSCGSRRGATRMLRLLELTGYVELFSFGSTAAD